MLAGVCPAAAALGLRPGQTVAHSQACIPGLHVAEADPQGDSETLLRLSHCCLRYAPLAAPDPPDGLWIDAAGSAHLHGGEAAMLANLRARLLRAGFAARAAIADTPGAAHAWARFGTGEAVLPHGAHLRAALDPLPVAALRLPPETLAALRRVGLERTGQLAEAPRAPLARRFGDLLLRRLDQALGRVFEPIEPVLPIEATAHRLAFAEPLLTAESFTAAIAVLAGRVCAMLERQGQGARRLDLLFERVDGSWQAIRAGAARPARDPGHIARLLGQQLETVDPGLGVEAMRLRVSLAEALEWTQAATDAAGGDAPDLAALVDRLAGRLGEGRVFRVEPVASRIPERSVRRVAALAPPSGAAWPPLLPRPPRLFDPPQPIEAMALLPDHPPAAFVWRRVRHRVRRADGPERVRGEWWRRDAEIAAVRDYFAVEDEAGRRFWLYRSGDGVDPASGDLRWFLHGMF